MKPIVKAALVELFEFVETYDLRSVATLPALRALVQSGFVKYYPLLILESALSSSPPWTNARKSTEFELYLKEVISDLCQALVLAIQGYYKPAYLSLRSGVENFVRCIGLSQDQNVLALTSVFELLDLVKATPLLTGDKVANKYYQILRTEYKTLCGYVHTSTSAHMAHTTFTGVFPRFVEPDAKLFFSSFNKVASSMCCLLCFAVKDKFKTLHHKHFDVVSDGLPQKVRQTLND